MGECDLITRLRAGDDLHVEAAFALERLRDRLVIAEAELAATLGAMREHQPSPGPGFRIAYEILGSNQKE